jgi:hypothetical protein
MNRISSQRTPAAESQPSTSRFGDGRPNPSPTSSRRRAQSCAELLLRCLTVSREPIAVSRKPTAQWSEVVALAADHYLTPLLYWRLKENGSQACVPADVWERLRGAHFASAVRNMSLYGKLRKVLQRLRSSGMKVIVLKGAYLAEAVYGDDALRPMTDIDLLVPRAELARTQAILLDMGVGQQQSENTESRRRQILHLAQVTIRDLLVELHWTITLPIGPVKVDSTGLWDRARPVMIAGVEVLALSPEDLLLHLCLHVCYQHFLEEGLRSFCDIAETIHRFQGEIDWPQVAARAREWGASRYVGLALHLARSMLGAGVPDAVLEQLVPGGLDQRILEAARESVLARTGYSQWMPKFDLLGAESFGDKARLLWQRVFLTRGEMAAIYPASRDSRHLYRYYVLRLRDVIRTYWSHTFRRGRLMSQSRGRDRHALVNWLSGKG